MEFPEPSEDLVLAVAVLRAVGVRRFLLEGFEILRQRLLGETHRVLLDGFDPGGPLEVGVSTAGYLAKARVCLETLLHPPYVDSFCCAQKAHRGGEGVHRRIALGGVAAGGCLLLPDDAESLSGFLNGPFKENQLAKCIVRKTVQ